MYFLLRNIPSLIDHEENKSLQAIPKEKKVAEVVFSFNGNKALGLDGFPLVLCAKILTHFYESLYPRLLKNEISNGDP